MKKLKDKKLPCKKTDSIYFSPDELKCFGKFSKELFIDNAKTSRKKLIQVFVEACAKLGIDAQDITDEGELMSEIIQAYKNNGAP